MQVQEVMYGRQHLDQGREELQEERHKLFKKKLGLTNCFPTQKTVKKHRFVHTFLLEKAAIG